jgi:hypothetical protein
MACTYCRRIWTYEETQKFHTHSALHMWTVIIVGLVHKLFNDAELNALLLYFWSLSLIKLSECNTIELLRVPKNNETVETETATQLTWTRSGHPFTGRELAYGIKKKLRSMPPENGCMQAITNSRWWNLHIDKWSVSFCEQDLGTIRTKQELAENWREYLRDTVTQNDSSSNWN